MRNLFTKKYRGGAYKVVFSVCIVVLCIITVVTTDNQSEKKVASTDKALDTTEMVSDEFLIPAEVETDDSYESTETVDSAYTDEYEEEYIIDYDYPVVGDIIKNFSMITPLYSETMDDWRMHSGIDISCEYGTEVVASEYGVVEEISHDINYGHYVSVRHDNVVCRYMSLESEIPVTVGENVAKGQLIGYVSDSAISEICDAPHFHFEIIENGEYVNPMGYIS